MKKLLYTVFLISPLSLFAQIGIGTTTPKRMVDVEGNLRVTKLNNVTTNNKYSHLLTTDNDGKIDKINFPALLLNDNADVDITKANYISTNADATKECQCGVLGFRLRNNDGNAVFELRIITEDVFKDLGADNFTINFGGKYFGNNRSYSNINYTLSFNKTNNPLAFKEVKNSIPTNEINIFTILIPKQNNLYRISVARLTNSASSNLNVLVCEKFYINEI